MIRETVVKSWGHAAITYLGSLFISLNDKLFHFFFFCSSQIIPIDWEAQYVPASLDISKYRCRILKKRGKKREKKWIDQMFCVSTFDLIHTSTNVFDPYEDAGNVNRNKLHTFIYMNQHPTDSWTETR